MTTFNAYWRLMRFDKPVGSLLLWFPTAWGLWLAGAGHPDGFIVLWFALGTILMRAAGCVINDLADRRFDLHVSRTQNRPLAAGDLQPRHALMAFFALIVLAFVILLQLPYACVPWAFAAVAITAIYPLCKRFISGPQLVLSLAFSMGIPMAYAALNVPFDGVFILLMLINCLWIIAYDTMYAMTDRVDDLRIGIRSTAIWFASWDVFLVTGMLVVMHGLWLLAGLSRHASIWFYLIWFLASGILGYQYTLIKNRVAQSCFLAFRRSVYYGGLMWLAVVLIHA